jgi:AbrB family looped-hinge helix DNA binding protein
MEQVSSVSPKGQITLPADVRRRLGIKPKDKVSISLQGEVVVLKKAASELRAGYRSIPALTTRKSLEELTEIAAEEHAEETAREGL